MSRFGHLSKGLVGFLVYKFLGVLWDVGLIAVTVFWAIPHQAQLSGPWKPNLVAHVVLPAVSSAAVIVGAILLIRGTAMTRTFWLLYLTLYSVAQFWQTTFAVTAGTVLPLVGSLAWMAYWVYGRRPQQIAVEASGA